MYKKLRKDEVLRLPEDLMLPEGVKAIPISRNKYTLVDEEDYDFLTQWKWTGHTYISRKEVGRDAIYMHRVVMDCPSHLEVDHKNGCKWDNRKANLRVCTRAENSRNRGKSIVRDYKGVYWNQRARKWSASIKVDRKLVYLGLHQTKAEAALAYNEAALKYHKKFARLNNLEGMDLIKAENANERATLIKALEACRQFFEETDYSGAEAEQVQSALDNAYKKTPRAPQQNRRTKQRLLPTPQAHGGE